MQQRAARRASGAAPAATARRRAPAARCRSGPSTSSASAHATHAPIVQREAARPRAVERAHEGEHGDGDAGRRPACRGSRTGRRGRRTGGGEHERARARAVATPCQRAQREEQRRAHQPRADERARSAPRTRSRRTRCIAAMSSQYISGGLWKNGRPFERRHQPVAVQHLERDARVAAFVGHQQRPQARAERARARAAREQRIGARSASAAARVPAPAGVSRPSRPTPSRPAPISSSRRR